MSNELLMSQLDSALSRAAPIMKAARVRGQFKTSEIAQLLNLLREATCAAQELDNRLRGNPPAKVGP